MRGKTLDRDQGDMEAPEPRPSLSMRAEKVIACSKLVLCDSITGEEWVTAKPSILSMPVRSSYIYIAWAMIIGLAIMMEHDGHLGCAHGGPLRVSTHTYLSRVFSGNVIRRSLRRSSHGDFIGATLESSTPKT